MRDNNQVVEIQGIFDCRLANFSWSTLSPSPVTSFRKGISSQDYNHGNKAEPEFGEGVNYEVKRCVTSGRAEGRTSSCTTVVRGASFQMSVEKS